MRDEPAVVVVGRKPRLHAAELRPFAERGDGLAQLRRLRAILGIEDDDVVGAHEGKGIGQSLRFGARTARRKDDHLEMRLNGVAQDLASASRYHRPLPGT